MVFEFFIAKQAAIFGTYAFADIATYLAYRDKLEHKLIPIFRDHIAMRNNYSAIVVNGARFANSSQQALAEAFLEYLVSAEGQSFIYVYGEKNYDVPLYTPAAHLYPELKSRRARIESEKRRHYLHLMTGMAVLLGIFAITMTWLWVRSRKIQHQVLHDPLTGLPNRVLLNDRIEQSIRTFSRNRRPFALIMIDLNGFKKINDRHGHHVGYELLRRVAMRLQQSLRKSDTVARLGGDEFAILLHNANLEYAQQISQNILFALRNSIAVYELRLHVGGSLGISVFPQHGRDTESLLQNADAAMYTAKRNNSGVATFSKPKPRLHKVLETQI